MLGYPHLPLGLCLPFHPPSTTPGNLECPLGTPSAHLPKAQPQGSGTTPQQPSCPDSHPPGSCSGCGPLSLPLLAGLLAADAVLSLLIVAVVCVCTRPRGRPTQGVGRSGVGLEWGVSLGRRSPGRGLPGKPWRRCWGNPGGSAWGNS